MEQKVTINNSKKFGIQDKVGYMFGDMGNTLTYSLVGSFLLIFYTNVGGVPGATVGVLFLIARFIDAIADVTVGRLADKTPLKPSGRFTPWVKIMRYPLLISAIILFMPFLGSWPMPVRIAYISVTYLAYGILYSSVNIPYGSMASAISNNPDDKTSLSTFRSVSSSLGSAVVSYAVPIFMYAGATNKISGVRFMSTVIVCACLAFIAYQLLCSLTTERVRTEKQRPFPLKQVMYDMSKNKALIVLVIVDLIIVISANISGAATAYLFNDYFQNKGAMAIAMIINVASSILLAPFASYLTRRFGRKESSIAGLIFAAVINAIMLVLHTHNVILFLALSFLGALGGGVIGLMIWAFITDVIDNQQVLTGEREDGIIYGVNSFSRKVAQAIGGGLSGVIISLIGYQASTSGGLAQSTEVVNRIYVFTVSTPVITSSLAAAVLILFYPLNKRKVIENAKILRERAEK